MGCEVPFHAASRLESCRGQHASSLKSQSCNFSTVTSERGEMAGAEPTDQAVSSQPLSIDARALYVVQHLIEQCLLVGLNEEECVATLAQRGIPGIITSVVWEQLQLNNPEFFAEYEWGMPAKAAYAATIGARLSASSSDETSGGEGHAPCPLVVQAPTQAELTLSPTLSPAVVACEPSGEVPCASVGSSFERYGSS
eukprot:jgi/Mesvir1/27129/Mv20803-RA.1